MHRRAIFVLLLFTGVASDSRCAAAEDRADLLLKGGRIVDGTGAPWYSGDIAVRDGKIIAIGRLDRHLGRARCRRDRLYVAPGFIDMMGQTGAAFLKNPRAADNLLTQGITTLNAGEGDSDAPLDAKAGQAAGWRTMAEFFAALEKAGMPLNIVQTVGHTQVRRLVLGDVDRQASSAELERMKTLVREAMEAGAIGLSTALIYPPAVYASTDEIAALAQVAGEYGGTYFTHMRNEGDRLLEAIDEALAIGKRAGTPVHIFHLKAAGKANWPKMEQALALHQGRSRRRPASDRRHLSLHQQRLGAGIVPPSSPRGAGPRGAAQEARRPRDPCRKCAARWNRPAAGRTGSGTSARDWDNVILSQIRAPRILWATPVKSLGQIAREAGKDPWDVFFTIVASGASALPRSMSEANVIKALRCDFISFCTDMGPLGAAMPWSIRGVRGAFPAFSPATSANSRSAARARDRPDDFGRRQRSEALRPRKNRPGISRRPGRLRRRPQCATTRPSPSRIFRPKGSSMCWSTASS